MESRDDRSEAAVARAIGNELRRVREEGGRSRAELVARLPPDVDVRAVLEHEHGLGQLTVGRLVTLCGGLDVPAADVLERALEETSDKGRHAHDNNVRAQHP